MLVIIFVLRKVSNTLPEISDKIAVIYIVICIQSYTIVFHFYQERDCAHGAQSQLADL